MRPVAPPLLPILRSGLVGNLLALLAADPERWWRTDELAARTGGSYPTVTREIRNLQLADLIDMEEVGRSKRVRINSANPLSGPLSDLMLRAFGPLIVVREEFGEIDGVDEVIIYGSWAARYAGEKGASPNDVDVLVLGVTDRDEVHDAARRSERRLGLPVNATVRRSEDWDDADDPFARQVKKSPTVAAVDSQPGM